MWLIPTPLELCEVRVMKSSVSGRPALEATCFLTVAAAYIGNAYWAGYERFYFDARGYWNLRLLFERHGHFSLLSYDNTTRGYSLPLLNYGLGKLGSVVGLGARPTVALWGALVAATLGVVVAPRLARSFFSNASIRLSEVIAFNALLFLFWRDHFLFPLSDFAALLLAAVGMLALARRSVIGYLGAGLAFGLAANVRPAYIPPLILVLAAAAFVPRLHLGWRRRTVAGALVFAGALVAAAPQILINHELDGGWSPTVQGERRIATTQLDLGMRTQRYETYVGPPARYPSPAVLYLDAATLGVLDDQGVTEISGVGQYARIALRHPTEMLGSYTRHVFNGLDVWQPTPYIRDLDDRWIALSVLQYTLLFVAAVHLLLPDARRALGRVDWAGMAVVASACLTAIPGPSDPRYYLPIQLLVYMLVCFGQPSLASLVGPDGGRRLGLAITWAAFVCTGLAFSSAALASREF
jgi:hypothetical protein